MGAASLARGGRRNHQPELGLSMTTVPPNAEVRLRALQRAARGPTRRFRRPAIGARSFKRAAKKRQRVAGLCAHDWAKAQVGALPGRNAKYTAARIKAMATP